MYLETARLCLKPYTDWDLQDYYRLRSCEVIWKYSTESPIEDKVIVFKKLSEQIAQMNLTKTGFNALYLRDSLKYIGEAGILSYNKTANRCVIGYNLLPDYWMQGYATEITKELINYAFLSMEVERVEALALKINLASVKVLEKSGFLREGILKNFSRIDGDYYDVSYYGLIREDYEKNRSEQNVILVQ